MSVGNAIRMLDEVLAETSPALREVVWLKIVTDPIPSDVGPEVAALWMTARRWAALTSSVLHENPEGGRTVAKGRETEIREGAGDGRYVAVSCRGKGCAGCCRGEVAVLPSEVATIADRLTDDHIARLLGYDSGGEPRKAICPLLDDDQSCSIYSIRPAVCRTYMSVSPVDWCFPERSGTRQVALPIDSIWGELLEDLVHLPGEPVALVQALLSRLRALGKIEQSGPPVEAGAK